MHNIKTLIPKFLHNLIEIKVDLEHWRVCDAPNAHKTDSKIIAYFKIGGFTVLRVTFFPRTIGPANFSPDYHLDFIGIHIIVFVNVNIITLGHFKNLLIYKYYTKPSILGFIFSKLVQAFNNFVVSFNQEIIQISNLLACFSIRLKLISKFGTEGVFNPLRYTLN